MNPSSENAVSMSTWVSQETAIRTKRASLKIFGASRVRDERKRSDSR